MGGNDDFPQIETKRFVLRQITLDDTEVVLQHFSDAEMLKYMAFGPLASKDQAENVIKWGINLYAEKAGVLWGIVEKESNVFIGTLNYKNIKNSDGSVHRTEITYDLARLYWGRGLMPEAIESTLPYVFENMGIRRIETTVNVHNFRSVKVLTKLGFQIEGVLREYGHLNGKLCDVITFSLLERDWQAHMQCRINVKGLR